MPVPEEVYRAAKIEAAKKGMLFRRWVEFVIADACGLRRSAQAVNLRESGKERTYEPIDS